MKSFILNCFFIFFAGCIYAQSGKVLSGDTTFWYNLQRKKCESLKLKQLISSRDKFHFRFWADQQAVDIWSVDGIIYSGLITNFTNSYAYNEKTHQRKASKTYSSQVFLDTAIAKKVFDLIKHIAEIPGDKFIKGWSQGFDGEEYIFETSTPSIYSFKTYWTPTAQDSSLVEAKMIRTFIKDLNTLLNLGAKYSDFFATLKPGAYMGDGPMAFIKLKPRQNRYFNKTKPNRDYLDSVKGKLNSYLSDTLTSIFNKYGGLACTDEFLLQFSKNNKLINISSREKLTDKDDKKEFINCRKKIEAAFRLINVDFVHSLISYREELTFWQGKAFVHGLDFL